MTVFTVNEVYMSLFTVFVKFDMLKINLCLFETVCVQTAAKCWNVTLTSDAKEERLAW